MPMIHQLLPDRHSLHGPFDKDRPPALTIDSGDTVRLATLDSAWGIEPRAYKGATRRKFAEFDRERDGGNHALTGPIYVQGAEPGMTLEIKINEIVPGAWGWSSAGGFNSYWNRRMGVAEEAEVLLDWALDRDKMTARSLHGDFPYEVAIRPFLGILGMPPAEPGTHSTFPPRFCGGNLDCKELTAGSILYLPIPVKGALLSVGDGHAVQGDGEVSGPALECPMERVDLTLTVRDDLRLTMPRAKTPTGWLTMGLHEDLDEAMWQALEGMLDLIGSLYGISRTEAYALASLTVDLRITQIVNGVKGVHAFLPHGAIKG
ncbi:acetamidase [Tumebacillus avium]|uniref:Acetamidase n=1 Tax=Tumebacillus avium TaxID=1903704 RepID=A0A1Y0IMX7_9BACL|nr:acetamidase/formamidase family protein [Tumebacillus avium]ARU61186.1 acetamidase [Tumebacillus avium]